MPTTMPTYHFVQNRNLRKHLANRSRENSILFRQNRHLDILVDMLLEPATETNIKHITTSFDGKVAS